MNNREVEYDLERFLDYEFGDYDVSISAVREVLPKLALEIEVWLENAGAEGYEEGFQAGITESVREEQ